MASSVEGASFERLRQYGSWRVFSDLELSRVAFTSCVLAQHDDPSFGLVVRDSVLRNCSFNACSMAGVKLESVTVDGARFRKCGIDGCVFRNVTLRGKIGQFILNGPAIALQAEMFASFSNAMVGFYRDVDWALDIRDAVFASAAIRAAGPGQIDRAPASTSKGPARTSAARPGMFVSANILAPARAAKYRAFGVGLVTRP
jgi:hypothetical protein